MRQCEAATTRGRRCRREAREYRNVRDGERIREALLCQEHQHQLRTGALRLAT